MGKSKNFGTTMMRELISKAAKLGITVDFVIKSDGKYIIDYGKEGYVAPTAAAACFFIFGIMAANAKPVGDLLTADWVKRPLIPAPAGDNLDYVQSLRDNH